MAKGKAKKIDMFTYIKYTFKAYPYAKTSHKYVVDELKAGDDWKIVSKNKHKFKTKKAALNFINKSV